MMVPQWISVLNNTDTYTENKWEISCSCFPHFQCIVIDSCNHMLIPQIPPDLIQQKMEHFSVWLLIKKLKQKYGKYWISSFCISELFTHHYINYFVTHISKLFSLSLSLPSLTMVTLGFRALTDSSTGDELWG